MWIFASHLSAATGYFTNDEVIGHFPQFVEDLIHGCFRDLSFCVQYPGDTIFFPVLTGLFVISVTLSNELQVLLTHNVLMEEAPARAVEITALNVTKPHSGRVSRGQP